VTLSVRVQTGVGGPRFEPADVKPGTPSPTSAAACATPDGVRVTFHRESGRAYHAIIDRPDGVVVRLKGGSYNPFEPPLPHDIAHLVVEDGLGLEHGLWGVIAAGGLFGQNAVLAGRRRPHAARRAREVVKAHHDELNQAEMLVGAICRLVHERREGDARLLAQMTGRWRPPPAAAERIPAVGPRLREAARRWDAVPVGGTLALEWGAVSRRARAPRAR